MSDLLTLERFKIALKDPDPTVSSPDDDAYLAAIASASEIIRSHTNRTFEVTSVGATATPRVFEYDASGYLDIDECHSITGVSVVSGYYGATSQTLTTDEWVAYPLNKPVKMWLTLSTVSFGGISPQMGFRYNLDTFEPGPQLKPDLVTVTGIWGWVTLPEDIIQAAIWTAANIIEPPKVYQSESIENYSRVKGPNADYDAIPDRAKDILQPYIVPRV